MEQESFLCSECNHLLCETRQTSCGCRLCRKCFTTRDSTFTCKKCGQVFNITVEEHNETICPEYKIPCSAGRDEKIPRKEVSTINQLGEHLEKYCRQQKRPCRYTKYGCHYKIFAVENELSFVACYGKVSTSSKLLQQYQSDYTERVKWIPGVGVAVGSNISVQEMNFISQKSELVVTKTLHVADSSNGTEFTSDISNCSGDDIIDCAAKL